MLSDSYMFDYYTDWLAAGNEGEFDDYLATLD